VIRKNNFNGNLFYRRPPICSAQVSVGISYIADHRFTCANTSGDPHMLQGHQFSLRERRRKTHVLKVADSLRTSRSGSCT